MLCDISVVPSVFPIVFTEQFSLSPIDHIGQWLDGKFPQYFLIEFYIIMKRSKKKDHIP